MDRAQPEAEAHCQPNHKVQQSTTMRKGRTTAAASASKPPVILRFVDDPVTTISLGNSDVPIPKHTVNNVPFLKNGSTAQRLFQSYGEPILTLFHRLGYSTANVPSAVLILHDQGPVINRQWRWAISRILNNLLNVQRVSFQSSIQLAPLSLSLPNFADRWLTVHMTSYEAQVMVFADAHSLEYTYHSVRFGSEASMPSTETEVKNLHHSNVSGIVKTMCLSIMSTPMELRRAAVGNIVLSGHVLIANYGALLAKALYQCIKTRTVDDQVDVAPQEIDFELLGTLANHIGLVETAVPPPNLAWMGACLWISRRQQQAVDENPVWAKLEQP